MVEKNRIFEKKYWLHFLFFAAAAILTIYFVPGSSHKKLSYEIGKPWTGPALYAAAQMAVPLDPATEKAKKDSIDKAFVPFFRYDTNVEGQAWKKLTSTGLIMSNNHVRNAFHHVYQVGIVDNSIHDSIRGNLLPNVRVIAGNNKVETRTTDGLFSMAAAYDYIKNECGGLIFSAGINFNDYILPNFVPDAKENKRWIEEEYRNACARAPIEKGELIIARGEKVSAQKAEAIRAYEKLADNERTGETHFPAVGFAVVIAGLFFLLLVYVAYYRKAAILDDKRKLLFLLIIVAGITILAYMFMTRFANGIYFVPITLTPVILVTFFDSRTAFFASVVQVLLCGLVVDADDQLVFILLHTVACMVAIDTLQELSKRSQLIRTAMFVFFTYSVGYVALYVAENGNTSGLDLRVFLFFAVNAILLSFAYVIIFVLEKLFGFISKVTLVELADVNSPLLRELSEKCPGTFQHSIQLSNLVTEAAREIGANSQLARAGALYHDIGKMDNPAFFTENQHDINPHELLTPEQSAKIVIRHVTDGVRRAEKAKLPSVIKDFILEHHGKNLAKYFYTTACNNSTDGKPVDPAPFTYPGPNPRSKETSLLMMADATEAASRSLKEYNDETISELVNRIIDGQIAQGLMKDSPLSFHDVEVVKKVFISRLRTMYHTRISYPEMKKKQ